MKAFTKKIFEASLNGNGWDNHSKHNTTYRVVFTGEMTGSWTICREGPQIRVTWSPSFGVALEGKKAKALIDWRSEAIERLYQWLNSCLHQATYNKMNNHANITLQPETLLLLAGHNDVTYLDVLEKIAENPNRVYSLQDYFRSMRRFSSHKDRVKFSKKFYETWSIYKSVPPWVKRVPKWKDFFKADLYQPLDRIKYLPVTWYLPRADWSPWDYTQSTAETMRRNKIPVTIARELLHTAILDSNCTGSSMVYDAYKMARNIDHAFLAGQRNGREILEALNNRKWAKLFRYHDRLSEIQREYYRTTNTQNNEDAVEHHKKCNWNHPSVRVLITKEDFIKEGTTMQHCIAGYHNNIRHWFAHISTEDGESSVMITTNGTLVQHYGVRNKTAPKANREIVKLLIQQTKQK